MITLSRILDVFITFCLFTRKTIISAHSFDIAGNMAQSHKLKVER